jgi:hypothetical protein
MSAGVTSRQVSRQSTAPVVVDDASFASMSLFETTARVTARPAASCPKPETTSRDANHAKSATRKRARASNHAIATTSASTRPMRLRVADDPAISPREDIASAVRSAPRTRSGNQPSETSTKTKWCSLPLLCVDATREPSQEHAEEISTGEDLESSILMLLTPVSCTDPTCSS